MNIAKGRWHPASRVLGTPRSDIHGTYERERFRYCCIATLGLPPLRSRRSDSAASDLFYHVTNTDTCSKAHAHTRPYRKCIISIDLCCSCLCYSYKISRLSQSKTKTYWCTARAAPTPYLLTSFPCHRPVLFSVTFCRPVYAPSLACRRPVLCSISQLSQACTMIHLSLVTGLFYSVTFYRPVLFCHFLQACSMPHLSLVTGLFYSPSLNCHRPVLWSISHLSQACSMLHLSLVTGLFYAPSLTYHRPVQCSISHRHSLCSICYLFAGLSHAPFLIPLLPTAVSVIPPHYVRQLM